jgi:hypothetical protein
MYRGILFQIQFIQHLSVFPLLYYALKVAKSDFIMTTVMGDSFFGKPINYISKITLELFIVDNSIESIVRSLKLPFPWNSILFLAAIAILAAIINYCSQYILKAINK